MLDKIDQNLNRATLNFQNITVDGGGVVSFIKKVPMLEFQYRHAMLYRLGKEIGGAKYSEDEYNGMLQCICMNVNTYASNAGIVQRNRSRDNLEETVQMVNDVIEGTINTSLNRTNLNNTFVNKIKAQNTNNSLNK